MASKFKRESRIIQIYLHFKNQLENVYMSQIAYENLPDTLDRWYLEKTFMYRGSASIFKVKDTDVLLCGDYISYGQTVYEKPARIKGVTNPTWNALDDITEDDLDKGIKPPLLGLSQNNVLVNGVVDKKFTGIHEVSDFVVGYDTMTRRPIWETIHMRASMLSQMWVTLEANLKMQHHPFVFVSENQKAMSKTVDRFMDGYNSLKDSFILGFNPDEIQVFHTNVPYLVDKLIQDMNEMWRQTLNELGVSSMVDKKERMIRDEVMMNQGEINANLAIRIQNRKEFIEEVNKKFNLDIELNLVGKELSYEFSEYAPVSQYSGYINRGSYQGEQE